jgi:hypothetical protein
MRFLEESGDLSIETKSSADAVISHHGMETYAAIIPCYQIPGVERTPV